jgi:hypothetical protein
MAEVFGRRTESVLVQGCPWAWRISSREGRRLKAHPQFYLKITVWVVLMQKDTSEKFGFKDRFYSTWGTLSPQSLPSLWPGGVIYGGLRLTSCKHLFLKAVHEEYIGSVSRESSWGMVSVQVPGITPVSKQETNFYPAYHFYLKQRPQKEEGRGHWQILAWYLPWS